MRITKEIQKAHGEIKMSEHTKTTHEIADMHEDRPCVDFPECKKEWVGLEWLKTQIEEVHYKMCESADRRRTPIQRENALQIANGFERELLRRIEQKEEK